MLAAVRYFLAVVSAFTALLVVLPQPAHAADGGEEKPQGPPWWDAKFSARKKLTIDLSGEGANIAEAPGTPTVLLRLHDGVFNFMAAAEDGSDLRFVTDDQKTVLPHHVEKWDGLLNEGYVWVKVPDLKGAAKTTIWMYYSALEAQAAPDTKKENFDVDTKLVYHFAEGGGAGVDSSPSGASAEGATTSASSSHIGAGQRLNGQSAITVPANPALAWVAGGNLTLSVWIKPAALQTKAVLFSRREGPASFIVQVDQGIPSVVVGGQASGPGAPLAPNVWAHLAVTAAGGTMTVYVNGAQYSTLSAPLPAMTGAISIGKDTTGTAAGFAGEIDELQMASIARAAAAIKFATVNQGTTPDAAKLLVVGEEEAAHHEEEGELMHHVNLLRDISKDLTLDGWVVIYCCAILAIIGWGVAFAKILYLNKISKATKEFLKRWSTIASDLASIDKTDDTSIKSLGGAANTKQQRMMKQSPVFQIYHLGCLEIRNRITSTKEGVSGLSGRAIQAIKATLHGGLVREVQKLNGKLVFLTISIAGGPYLGLLGTVIGVMITFAVIAKSGEVEVNSIAPGIAGALLATVAGLAVAIPALFLYSYLASRIKDAVSDMEIFIDEFVAKMAEIYPESKN